MHARAIMMGHCIYSGKSLCVVCEEACVEYVGNGELQIMKRSKIAFINRRNCYVIHCSIVQYFRFLKLQYCNLISPRFTCLCVRCKKFLMVKCFNLLQNAVYHVKPALHINWIISIAQCKSYWLFNYSFIQSKSKAWGSKGGPKLLGPLGENSVETCCTGWFEQYNR